MCVLSVQVRFSAFKVVNVLAVCSMPFAIRLIDFTKNNRPIARWYNTVRHTNQHHRYHQLPDMSELSNNFASSCSRPYPWDTPTLWVLSCKLWKNTIHCHKCLFICHCHLFWFTFALKKKKPHYMNNHLKWYTSFTTFVKTGWPLVVHHWSALKYASGTTVKQADRRCWCGWCSRLLI